MPDDGLAIASHLIDTVHTGNNVASGTSSVIEKAGKIASYGQRVAAESGSLSSTFSRVSGAVETATPYLKAAAMPIAVAGVALSAGDDVVHAIIDHKHGDARGQFEHEAKATGTIVGAVVGGIVGGPVGVAIGGTVGKYAGEGVAKATEYYADHGHAFAGIGSAASKYAGDWIDHKVGDAKSVFNKAASAVAPIAAIVSPVMVVQANAVYSAKAPSGPVR